MPTPTDAELTAMYAEGISAVEIARRVGYPEGQVRGALIRAGTQFRTANESKALTRQRKAASISALDREMVDMYESGATLAEIGRKVGLDGRVCRDRISGLGVQIRTGAESRAIARRRRGSSP